MITDTTPDFDVAIVGAGFGGLRMLIELRRLGLSVRAFEVADDVGGTWYWNRYPGARTDSESFVYCMRDPDILQEWDWTERFPGQAEVERYLQHVADRHDLRTDIEFNTWVSSASYDDDANLWTITTREGVRVTAKYFISASGLISVPLAPSFEGIESFEGEAYVTGRWPKERVDFRGKRVGVVGTGATAIQIIPLAAQEAAALTVFQRTANYALPGRNHAVDGYERRANKMRYEDIWAAADQHFFGFDMQLTGRVMSDYTPAERDRILERGWESGGFRYIFETFDDILVVDESNEVASEFIRNKIRAIVENPATAELLCPDNHGVGAKRPPLGHYYYEAFNRDNVRLVDVRPNPIERVTPKGIRLADGTEHDLDIIIFATGFDAGTGAMLQFDVRGRGGKHLQEVWADGPQTHMGVAVKDFPNMFMISGPQTPFANIPVVIEHTVRFIARALERQRETGTDLIEVTQEAMDAWAAHLDVLVNATVLSKGEHVRSWFLGANVPGKPHKVLFHFGGVGMYTTSWNELIADGWRGFVFVEHEPATADIA